MLVRGSRRATVVRKTSETDIAVAVDLNGEGAEIATGLGCFDHMLDQIARHGAIGLSISAKGDLHIDEHHTIEDTALALGEALREALGSKKGVGRYGFALPMDEARAEVLLDLGGRPCVVWDARFDREYVGDFPTEMTRHFFESLAHAAKLNLHVAASGGNAHHTVEAIFKAFARALREAVRVTGGGVPSSKGSL
jgi:imidazoleglycerol-phosphate dehydratase/histidinol-phosphatase